MSTSSNDRSPVGHISILTDISPFIRNNNDQGFYSFQTIAYQYRCVMWIQSSSALTSNPQCWVKPSKSCNLPANAVFSKPGGTGSMSAETHAHISNISPLASHTYAGKLIAAEGLDGSGKSTQLQLLQFWLQEEGFEVLIT